MRVCPKCGNNIICELQLDEEKTKSYLHEYCEKCGWDNPVDPFNKKYREKMSEFSLIRLKNFESKR